MYLRGYLLAIGMFLLFLSGCSFESADPNNQEINQGETSESKTVAVAEASTIKTVDVVNAEGTKIGVVTLKEEKNGVRLQIEISKLKPGKHGYHIHEKVFEGTNFKSAGDHFNPTQKEHGLQNPKGPHIGDMHNLRVKEDGTAVQTELIEGATLKKGHPYSLLGKSIIIHADEDDQVSNPAGNSGDRIAGGNIIE